MSGPPTLRTARLVLRPFTVADAPDVQRLAGAPEVAATTLNIPHPYADGMAEKWIGAHTAACAEGREAVFAVTLDGALAGAVGLVLERAHRRAEMGWWIGVPYWRRGLATEAARAALDWGFESLGLHKVLARHVPENPASERVMEKLGMTREGVQRQHVLKNGRFRDLVAWAILRPEWEARRTAG